MTCARAFYDQLSVPLPGTGLSGEVSVRCFANAAAHAHDDRTPSCRVSLDTGQWNCHGCGASGGAFDAACACGRSRSEAAELARRHGLFPDDGAGSARRAPAPRRASPAPAPLPSEADLSRWTGQLYPARAQRLWERRRWTSAALSTLGVGVNGKAFVLPLRGSDGELVNVLRLTGEELKPLAMRGRPRVLWPAPESIPAGERVYIVEGEKDVLSMCSIGLAAVAVPGANGWRSEWAVRFAGRDVAVFGDCDAAGRRLATNLAADLAPHAAMVRVIDLDAARSDGFDVGDLIGEAQSRDDLPQVRALLERMAGTAEPYRRSTNPDAATDIDQPASPAPADAAMTRTPAASASDLLDRVSNVLDRFVVLPGEAAKTAIALFVLHTWAFEAAHATPYMVIVSPEKQSGKTRLLEVLELLVREHWRTASTTEAALFRKIEQDRPTLLLDEIDAIFGSNSERTEPLRAALNAGNRRGAKATRVVGQGAKMEARDFSVFCPKVLAGIDTGRLPETIQDRAVTLHMTRRRDGEHVERLRWRAATEQTEPLRLQLQAWAATAIDVLREAEPETPDELSDRAADGWEPLFAVADLAGGDWPSRARAAAITLSAASDGEEIGRGTQLLAAIRRAMGTADVASTADLLAKINADETMPFGGWHEGKGIDPRTLARLLKPYEVKPRTVRIGPDTAKGYHAADLADAWARYLPPPEASQPSHASHPADPTLKGPRGNSDVTAVTDVTDVAGVAPQPTVGDGATPTCAHPEHSSDWRPHPATRRVICWRCQPPAGRSA